MPLFSHPLDVPTLPALLVQLELLVPPQEGLVLDVLRPLHRVRRRKCDDAPTWLKQATRFREKKKKKVEP